MDNVDNVDDVGGRGDGVGAQQQTIHPSVGRIVPAAPLRRCDNAAPTLWQHADGNDDNDGPDGNGVTAATMA